MEINTLTELKHIEKVLKNIIRELRQLDNDFNNEAKSKLIKAYAEVISTIIQYEDPDKFKFQERMFNDKKMS